MPGLVLTSGEVTTPPVGPLAGIQEMTWTGANGTTFDLLDVNAGVFVTSGIRGMNMPPHSRMTAESPAVAGSRWTASRTLERPVFWPVFLYSDAGSRSWAELDRAWWATMRPDQVGTWSVTGPMGEQRTLQCRYEDDGDHVFDRDPSAVGWEVYGISMVAEDPYWRGPQQVRTWEAASSTAFFPGPPFVIGSSHTLDTATITNPGDVDAYPTWVINGPITNAEVGVDGRIIEVPITLSGGEFLTIDTDPAAQTVIDDTGADRTAELGEADFAPVPPGTSVPLSLDMTGTGTVTAGLTPRFLRAW